MCYFTHGQMREALQAGADCLHELHIEFPMNPTKGRICSCSVILLLLQ
jgi:hypothetical protein